MRRRYFVLTVILLVATIGSVSPAGAELKLRNWTVEGVERQALLAIPADATQKPVPVVFAFHGHGGSMRNAARSIRIHEVWSEALVVYMQGLNTPGQLTDPEGKRAGWQKEKGDQKDRDLFFFDAVMKTLNEEFKVDASRIYATGHSNGGSFTYLLWAERPENFAAFAPSGCAALKSRTALKARPMLHIAGKNDPLVKFAWQSMMIESVKKTNQCGEGVPWEGLCTLYPSKIGAPVVTYITSSGHKFPAEAPALIAKFFKEHSKE